MKAEINAEGRLTVTPETELEFFALGRWFDLWIEHRVTFCCEILPGRMEEIKATTPGEISDV